MDNLKTKAGEALKTAALNESAKQYVLQNPILFNLLLKGAKRYIGGKNLEDAILTVKRSNENGIPTSLEFMGESVTSREEVEEVTEEFLKIIDQIKKQRLNSIISLDLSHIGLAIDKELAFENLKLLAGAADKNSIEIMISAEGIERTDKIIELFCEISPFYPRVGITLQAYLHRTANDLETILKRTQGEIRLVKGAFAVPEDHALGRGEALDERYIKIIEKLFIEKRRCSIATHHDKIQNAVINLIKEYNVPNTEYEFEMLYGIREDLFLNLKKEGYSSRRYIVYGKEWYLYVCNRIAENPDNLFQFIIDVME